jgi:DNA-binding XRE family transcriptional regulator
MKNKNYYIVINLNDFKIRLCSCKTTVAKIVGVNRNTLASLKERAVFNGYLIVATPIESAHK